MKINSKIIERISSKISNGSTHIRACLLCDIAEKTFYNWKNRGLEDIKNNIDSLYSQFVKAIDKAEQLFIEIHVNNIQEQSLNDWKCSAWLLERKHKKEFAKIEMIEHAGEIKTNATIDPKNLKTETIKDILSAYSEKEESVEDDE